MAIPATGTTWRAGGFGDVDARFNTRGGLAAILIRDNRGSDTNISPWQTGNPPTAYWSPFAQDGTPRDDLFAHILVDGEWIANPLPNEGFHLIGALTEDGGPERSADISNDNQMILQSNMPFDSDLTSEGLSINFTGVETVKPLMKRLRMNLALGDVNGNSIVEDPGTDDFNIGKPIDNEGPEYQIILMFARRKRGKFLYTAEGYSLCKLNDIGSFRRSKTDPDAGSLGYIVLPDPYFIGKDPNSPTSNELVPLYYAEWVAGEAWTDLNGTATPKTVTILGAPTAGTFTLTYRGKTTAAIAYNATAAAVTSALAALDDGYLAADFTVTGSAGGPYSVTLNKGGTLTGAGSFTGGTNPSLSVT